MDPYHYANGESYGGPPPPEPVKKPTRWHPLALRRRRARQDPNWRSYSEEKKERLLLSDELDQEQLLQSWERNHS